MLNSISKSISVRINQYISNNNAKELTNFIKTESLDELLSLKLGENNMTILHKVVLSNNLVLLNEVMSALKQKTQQHQKRLHELINKEDLEGNTPLHYAAFRGSIDMINVLLSNGSNYKMKSAKGLNVIHMATQGDQVSAVIFFKEQLGMNINSKDNSGSTPLHWAAYSSAEHCLNFLLAFRLEVNAQDGNGNTPLHISIFTENLSIMKILIEKGADSSIRNKEGKTAIDLAKDKCNSERILSLITSANRKYIKSYFYNSNQYNRNSKQGIVSFYSIGFVFMLLTLVLLTYYFLVPYIDRLYSGLLLLCVISSVISFGYISYSNPGYASIEYINESWLDLIGKRTIKIESLCPYCKSNVGSLTKHCFQCGQCVSEYYHHCNWMNNCIGEGNYGLYIVFLLVLLIDIVCIYTVAMMAYIGGSDMSVYRDTVIFTVPYNLLLKNIMAISMMTICVGVFGVILFLFFNQIRKMLIHRRVKDTSITRY